MKSARWLLGKGENVKIAQDPWIASGVRIDNFMHPEIEFVSSLIDQANTCWNVPLLRRFFNPPLVDQILQTPFSWFGGDDKLWWPFTKTGEYSVKSGYWQIKQHQQSTTQATPSSSMQIQRNTWDKIWKSKVPQKLKIFMWKICQGILPVREMLKKRRIATEDTCPVCKQGPESMEHALLLCQWTRSIWFGLQIGLRPDSNNVTNMVQWLEDRIEDISKMSEQKEMVFTTICCALWGIWKMRNRVVFEGKLPEPITTLFQISGMVQDYMSVPQKTNTPIPAQQKINPMWRPPPTDVIKMNVDASFDKDTGQTSFGIVGRNHEGNIVTDLTKSSVALSPLSAEAQALREAISLAVNMGLARILFESDCLELIRAWVGRNGNKLAHTLAQMNKRNVLPGDWRWRPPLEQFGQEDGLLATEQIHLSNDVDLESFPPDLGIFEEVLL